MGKAGTTAAKKTAAAKRKPAAAKKKAGSAAAKATKKAAPAASKAKKKAAAAPKKAAATRKKAPGKAVAPAKAKKAAPKKPPAKGKKGGGAAGPATGKRGLKGQAAPDVSSGRVGKVDPAAGLSNEAVLAEQERDVELDAMLSQIDIKNNVDKYFVLQVICEPASVGASKKKTKTAKTSTSTSATGEQFYFFTRWGRTGTSGQGKLEGPHDTVEEAAALFAAKFEEKTGNEWEVDDHEDRYVVNKGKYACLRPKTSQIQAETWQYWVDDKVDGKADGWYDYGDGGAMVVEQLFSEFQTNPTMSQRVVTSGLFTYLVDLAQMTQTNVGHPNRKMRHIRRNPGKSLPNTPPGVSTGGSKGKGKASPSIAVKAAPASTTAEVDKCCPKAGNKGVSVCAGHDAKMNQTNIASNNNKFYILQMCRDDGRNNYFVWCRWGRVGELGAMAELGPFADEDGAKTAFAKKFRDKTGNKWADAEGGNFSAVPGKYELIETDSSDTTAAAAMVASGGGPSSPARPAKVLPSALDADTKELVELIFSEDMFKSAMSTMNIDVKKMPLGQLSNAQVQRGYAVLEELEDALISSGRNRATLLETLSAKFYQVIPHAFGRQRPPVINTDDMLRAKVEMLNVLQDIGEAQTLLSSTDSTRKGKGKGKGATAAKMPTVPHPTDVNYEALNADLKLLSPSSHEYKTIKTYMENTKPGYGNMEMYNVWSVDRRGEGQRFKAHDKVANRKLLWHGTNVAVVAAIVKSGLRIMPHSGGRVGKGIYLASENAKSRQYVRPAYGAKGAGVNLGIMFLCEAALGKEASITVDDWKLTQPPPGYDSIVARGAQEPDPAKNVVIKIDGKAVSVPQGKPQPQPAYKGSRFSNSEYLVYKESQQRIRYMLTVKC